ncbi:MAG: hypothetical protein FVQ86_10600 [candidate division NC10 bacterium]|jgi:hypothetical protein|nr:hypothetical protein [candidate division NC10 bacterium]
MICKRCGKSGGEHFHRVESFERIALADDPADPNCGHYYVEVVHVMHCSACEHRQETMAMRWPFQTLREAETERDSHIIGKG